MLLQFIFMQMFIENLIISLVQSNAMIINQPRCIYLLMQFIISLRLVKFETKSLHSPHLDILPTPKSGRSCYQQPSLKNLSLTRSPARVDAPTLDQIIRQRKILVNLFSASKFVELGEDIFIELIADFCSDDGQRDIAEVFFAQLLFGAFDGSTKFS